MANVVINIAKGRVAEYGIRINANDPVNSVFNVIVVATAGVETDAVLIDKADVGAFFVGTTDEATNAGYARKVLDQTGGVTVTVDTTNDRTDVDIPDQTWTAVAAGSGFNDVLIAYDSDSTVGTDANIIPCTLHDFVLVPDGSDITAQIAVFFRAS